MFRGNHPTRVDEKGRLKLPADFMRVMDENYGKYFFITSRDGQRAEIWPLPEWKKIEDKLAAIPSMNPAKKKFLDVTNYYGQMVELDPQGRLTLPLILRESAKVTAEVVVLGAQTYLEVVNHDDFKAKLDADPLSEADLAALADLGL